LTPKQYPLEGGQGQKNAGTWELLIYSNLYQNSTLQAYPICERQGCGNPFS
jgi:hypothetical protein